MKELQRKAQELMKEGTAALKDVSDLICHSVCFIVDASHLVNDSQKLAHQKKISSTQKNIKVKTMFTDDAVSVVRCGFIMIIRKTRSSERWS